MIGRVSLIRVVVACLVAAALAPATLAQVPAKAQGTDTAPGNPFFPPPCTGIFPDVACPGGFAVNWIEQYSRDGITAGCGGGLYCPSNYVTRAEMAVFVGKAMRGTANWTPGDLGSANTGLGAGSLYNNTSYAVYNTAIGHNALQVQSFTNGNVNYDASNTAVGDSALYYTQPDGGSANLNGTYNTAVGSSALQNNTVGYQNAALGGWAGATNTTGWANTFVGYNANPQAPGTIFNATAIGFNVHVDASNKVLIGNTDVTVIGGQVNWTAFSDLRGKKDIADLDRGLDLVMKLRPVSYQLKNGNGRTDMGFVAQDIEALLGDGYNVLSIGGDADRTLALRYTDLIAPLVKAVQQQQALIEALRSDRDNQIARIEALERRLQVLIADRLAPRESERGDN